ncbi:MAG: hypothetical protein JWL89_364, partial [Candidatus Saccharibacteria bacterium]|nr:hypothetical protein [Candidatus Saccharibacteria bacterium]
STTPAPTTPAATTPAAPATATPTTEVASTTGIAVVTVLNQHNQPVKDAVVTIGAVTGTTDKNGQVTLRGLTPGSTSGSIKYGDQKKAITVEVASGAQLPKAQKFTIQTKNTSALVPISAGILLLVIIGVATFLLLDHGRSARSLLQKLHKHPSPDTATDADLKFNTTTITPQTAPSASVLPAKPLPLTPAPTHTDFAPRQPIPESHPTPTVAPEPATPTPPAPAAPRPLRPRNIAISREHAMEPGTIVRPSVDGFHRA